MPPKTALNGFYLYMQDQRKKIQAQTKRMPSMNEMAQICRNSWQHLSPAERARYDNLAKQEKERLRKDPDKDRYRMDNQGEIIAFRVNEKQEERKRRERERKELMQSWADKDVLGVQFHLIDFQVMYIPPNHLENHDKHYLPMEVGLTCFTLKEGIQKSLHQLINPGDAPQGNRHIAISHSQLTHQIPLNFDRADDNFLGIWMRLEKFLVDDPNNDDIPPIFCLSTEVKIVESCLEFIHLRTNIGSPMRLKKVYCIEDLVTSLILQSPKVSGNPAEHQIFDTLRQNRWDYTSSIRCKYHEEQDCSHCALSIVKRTSFAIFDNLSGVLDFQLTANHMPDETDQCFTVFHPGPSSASNRSGTRGGGSSVGSRGNRSSSSSLRSPSPPSFTTPVHQSPARGAVGGVPVARMQAMSLNDEEESDEEREKCIPSTADHYQLKELRKPKTLSVMGGIGAQTASIGRGLAAYANRAADGRRMLPSEAGAWGRPVAVAPPPGIAPPPGVDHTAATAESDHWPTLGEGQGDAKVGLSKPVFKTSFAAAGRGRGRGMPRQLP